MAIGTGWMRTCHYFFSQFLFTFVLMFLVIHLWPSIYQCPHTHSTKVTEWSWYHVHSPHTMFILLIPCSFSSYHVHSPHTMFILLIPCSFSSYHVHSPDTIHVHSPHTMFILLIPCSFSWYHVHSPHTMFILLIPCSFSSYHVHSSDIVGTVTIVWLTKVVIFKNLIRSHVKCFRTVWHTKFCVTNHGTEQILPRLLLKYLS